MNIHEKLCEVQNKLKAPKGQYNAFGKYHYRNCEDILEAVKPILKDLKLTIRLNDEIVNIGERYYIKSTITLTDCETGETAETTAYAREEESKKGMDGSQVTGASSSYARKYALNGLFAIDDAKDSDTTNQGGTEKKAEPNKGISDAQLKRLYAIGTEKGFTPENVKYVCDKKYKCEPKDLNKASYDNLCNDLENKTNDIKVWLKSKGEKVNE